MQLEVLQKRNIPEKDQGSASFPITPEHDDQNFK